MYRSRKAFTGILVGFFLLWPLAEILMAQTNPCGRIDEQLEWMYQNNPYWENLIPVDLYDPDYSGYCSHTAGNPAVGYKHGHVVQGFPYMSSKGYNVTAAMVNAYWDWRKPAWTRIAGADEKFNCYAYATDRSDVWV